MPLDFGEHEDTQQMLTADEKVNELNQFVEMQQQENEQLRHQLDQLGNDKISFVREKIDDLVHKEV